MPIGQRAKIENDRDFLWRNEPSQRRRRAYEDPVIFDKVTLGEALGWVGEYSKPERFADIRRPLASACESHVTRLLAACNPG